MLAYVVAMDLSDDERPVFHPAALGGERLLPPAAEGRGGAGVPGAGRPGGPGGPQPAGGA